MARRYLARLDALAPAGADRVVDKMPDNVHYLGLIALLLPEARVVVCSRDPRDVALSCWQTGFRACSWNNDWDLMARRLADYQRIVAHWERVRPLPLLHVPYEEPGRGPGTSCPPPDRVRWSRMGPGVPSSSTPIRASSARPAWCRCVSPSIPALSADGGIMSPISRRCSRRSERYGVEVKSDESRR